MYFAFCFQRVTFEHPPICCFQIEKSSIFMSMKVQDFFCVCYCDYLGGYLWPRAWHERYLPTKQIYFSICARRVHLSVQTVYRKMYDMYTVVKKILSTHLGCIMFAFTCTVGHWLRLGLITSSEFRQFFKRQNIDFGLERLGSDFVIVGLNIFVTVKTCPFIIPPTQPESFVKYAYLS